MADLRLHMRLTADGKGFVGEVRASREELRKLSAETDRAGGGSERMAKSTGRLGAAQAGATRAMKAFGGALLAGGAITGAVQLARSLAAAGVELESWQVRLRAATGSQAAGAAAMSHLRSEADRLGLDLGVLANSYAGLAASTRGTNLEGQATRDIFAGVSEAAAAMQLSAEDLDGVMQALSQIVGKGTVSMEELRQQLSERLPGAFQAAARAMERSTEDLEELVSSGELTAEELLPKLSVELQRTFGPGLEAATTSAQANFNRLGNAVRDLKQAAANSGILDFLSSAAKGATTVIRAISGQVGGGADSGAGIEAALADLRAREEAALERLQSGDVGPDRITGTGVERAQREIEAIRAEIEELSLLSADRIGEGIAAQRAEIERLRQETAGTNLDSLGGQYDRRRIEEAEQELERRLELERQYQRDALAVEEQGKIDRANAAARAAAEEASAEREQQEADLTRRKQAAQARLHLEEQIAAEAQRLREQEVLEAQGFSSPEERDDAAHLEAVASARRQVIAAGREEELRIARGYDSLEQEEAARHQEALEEIRTARADEAIRERYETELLEAQGFHSQREAEEARHQETLEAIRLAREEEATRERYETELLEAQGFHSQREAEELAHQQRLIEIEHQRLPAVAAILSDLEALHVQSGQQQVVTALGVVQGAFAELGALSGKAFKVAQAAAIAQTIISTISGAQAAFAAGLRIPAPAPIPQIAAVTLAATALASGYARVQAIRSQRPPTAFARGGVVDKPTYFQSPSVPQGGVAGEAGPEAIIPLRRGARGELGVGAPPLNLNVNVIDRAGVDVSTSSRRTGGGIELSLELDRAISEAVLSGPRTAGALKALGVRPGLEGR